MVVLSALLMIALVVFTIAAGSNTNLVNVQDSISAKSDAYALSAVLNYVYLAGDGASYSFTTKNMLEGENITISGFSVSVDRGRASQSASILDGKVNTSSPGLGHMLVTNNRGEIDIGK